MQVSLGSALREEHGYWFSKLTCQVPMCGGYPWAYSNSGLGGSRHCPKSPQFSKMQRTIFQKCYLPIAAVGEMRSWEMKADY